MMITLPKIAIVGYGRSGKDTAGEWFGNNTALTYSGSTSAAVCPMIAAELGITPEEAYATRHKNRQFWYEWCNEYRKDDPARIIREVLSRGDMAIGIRDVLELEAAMEEQLFDLIIWVHRDVPYDQTVTFTRSHADIVIDNTSTLARFHERLRTLAKFAKIPEITTSTRGENVQVSIC